jgi:hypothetical protein
MQKQTTTILQAVGRLAVEAINELGWPITIVLVGHDGWCSITRHDGEMNLVRTMLGDGSFPDEHAPITMIIMAPNERVKTYRLGDRVALAN